MISSYALPHIFVRWLEFMGLTTLVGGLAFQFLVLQPNLFSRQDYQTIERHLLRVQTTSLLLVALASLAGLILRTLVMSGGSPATLDVALPALLGKTHYGAAWIARSGLLGLLGAALLLRRFGVAASPWFSGAFFCVASFVALTITLSGHAADWGDVTVPVLVDWLHLLAVSIWFGGLFTFGFILKLKRSLVTPGMEDMGHGLSSIAKPFSGMAAGCVAVFLATGLYNSWLQVGSISALTDAAYGWTLLVKLVLVGGVLVIAAVNRYYFLATLVHRSGGGTGELIARTIRRFISTPQSRFSRFVRLEWMIIIGTLACSALLTQLMPARHVRHLERLRSQEHHGSHPPAHNALPATPLSPHR